jgi:hypothetical protein
MSYTRIKNIYENLGVDELGEPSTTQIGRKAVKKLREIETLKKKPKTTTEERKKISAERHWMNILHPEDSNPDIKPSAKDLKKQAEKEKRWKREEEKNNKKAIQAQKEQEEWFKREQARLKAEEQTRKTREEAREKARIQFESQREQLALEKVLDPFHEIPLALVIYKEYITISTAETHKIAFRKLSMKYHPDKNPTRNTTLHQQILHHIHEKITKK